MRSLRTYTMVALFAFGLIPSVSAAELCHRVLMVTPSEAQVELTIESLARLKHDLDLSMRAGAQDTPTKLLEQKYTEKMQELTRDLNISEGELRKQIRQHIVLLQEKKNQDSIREVRERLRHKEAAVKAATPDFDFKRKIPVKTGNSAVLSDNGKTLLFENLEELEALNLETGKKTQIPYDAFYILKDRALINKDQQWQTVDLDTLQIKDLQTSLPADPTSLSFKISADKTSLLCFSTTLNNGPRDRFIYQLFDQSGKLLEKSDIPTDFPVYSVMYMGDQHWIIESSRGLYKFTVASKTFELIGSGSPSVVPVPGTNKVLLHQGVKLHEIDLVTGEAKSRYSQGVARPFFVNSEFILLWERLGSINRFWKLDVDDLTEMNHNIKPGNTFAIGTIPGTPWVYFHDLIPSRITRPGVYSMHDLEVPLFNYGGKFDSETKGRIISQWVTLDGKRLLIHVSTPGQGAAVEVWERP